MAKSEELAAARDWQTHTLRWLRVAIIMFGDDPKADKKLRTEGKRVQKLSATKCLKEPGFRQWAREFHKLYPIAKRRKRGQQSIPGVSTG